MAGKNHESVRRFLNQTPTCLILLLVLDPQGLGMEAQVLGATVRLKSEFNSAGQTIGHWHGNPWYNVGVYMYTYVCIYIYIFVFYSGPFLKLHSPT